MKIECRITDDYIVDEQFIFGFTINREVEHFGGYTWDDGPAMTRCNKYEVNLWLGIIGLHIIIHGRRRKL